MDCACRTEQEAKGTKESEFKLMVKYKNHCCEYDNENDCQANPHSEYYPKEYAMFHFTSFFLINKSGLETP